MKNLRRTLLPITTFVKVDLRRLFRDKVAIFFVFVFPLIFLIVFGGIFGGDNNVSFRVALVNESESKIAKEVEGWIKQDTKLFEVDDEITSLNGAQEKMSRGQLDAAIVLPRDFGNGPSEPNGMPFGQAKVHYTQNNQQASQALASILQARFGELNMRYMETPLPFTVDAEQTNIRGLKQFDYTFAGLLGFSVLSLGIFGPTSVFPRLKQRGVLRRYQTTTLKVWQYFVGNVISNAAVGLMSVGLMFIVARLFFDLSMEGDYLSLIGLVVLGVTVLFGIGLAVGGWAKNENQAAPLANLITFPMMFLSGVFFPRFLMPEWLQDASGLLPLTPVVDGIRLIITEGKTLLDLGSQVGLLAIWAVVIYFIAFKVFRWE